MMSVLCACTSPQKTNPVLTGLIDATEIDVASKIAGRIKKCMVEEGQQVQQGSTLVTIESQEMQAKVDQVRAGIGAAKAKLKLAKHGAREEQKNAAEKALAAAQHQLDLAKKMYDRMVPLKASDSITQAQFDEVEFKYNVAKDQFAMAEAKYTMVVKGARKEEIEALEALVEQGQATLHEVESYDRETTQIAPISAEVAKIILHPGELAAPGFPIITLVDTKNLWASFALREDYLRTAKKGDVHEFEVPALGKTIKMKIFQIAALGDFATWQATSEKDSFDLKTFQVKARPVDTIEGLRPGMTVRWTLSPSEIRR
jgi:HlyD family secretion protein